MGRRVVTAGVSVLGLLLALATPAGAYPPAPPGEAVTRAHLAALTVAPDGSMAGYDRSKFDVWSDLDNDGCDARDEVLLRDGINVTVDSDCEPTSGRWYSVYDSQWVDDDSRVHIDHVVSLAEAWRTGAADWTARQRQAFANDLDSPELIAVSAESNLDKNDAGPAQWKPSNAGYRCMYARSWIHVKYLYDLTVTTTEKQALETMLDRC